MAKGVVFEVRRSKMSCFACWACFVSALEEITQNGPNRIWMRIDLMNANRGGNGSWNDQLYRKYDSLKAAYSPAIRIST